MFLADAFTQSDLRVQWMYIIIITHVSFLQMNLALQCHVLLSRERERERDQVEKQRIP